MLCAIWVEIGPVVLEKKSKIGKVYRKTDGRTDRQTRDDRRSEKLTWAFSPGELKKSFLQNHFSYHLHKALILNPFIPPVHFSEGSDRCQASYSFREVCIHWGERNTGDTLDFSGGVAVVILKQSMLWTFAVYGVIFAWVFLLPFSPANYFCCFEFIQTPLWHLMKFVWC